MNEKLLGPEQLRTFVAVARTGSLTKAAEEVFLTQSAVSRQMKDLERSLSTPPLERFGRGVRLTPAGETLLNHALKILGDIREAVQAVHEIEEGVAGELRLGTTVTVANYLLPQILAAYRREHPHVRVILKPAASTKLLTQLRRNELDLAVAENSSVPDPDLKIWREIDDPIVMVAPPAHKLAGRRSVSPAQIGDEDMILREQGSGSRRLVDEWARVSGISLRILMDMW